MLYHCFGNCNKHIHKLHAKPVILIYRNPCCQIYRSLKDIVQWNIPQYLDWNTRTQIMFVFYLYNLLCIKSYLNLCWSMWPMNNVIFGKKEVSLYLYYIISASTLEHYSWLYILYMVVVMVTSKQTCSWTSTNWKPTLP